MFGDVSLYSLILCNVCYKCGQMGEHTSKYATEKWGQDWIRASHLSKLTAPEGPGLLAVPKTAHALPQQCWLWIIGGPGPGLTWSRNQLAAADRSLPPSSRLWQFWCLLCLCRRFSDSLSLSLWQSLPVLLWARGLLPPVFILLTRLQEECLQGLLVMRRRYFPSGQFPVAYFEVWTHLPNTRH